MGVVGRINVDRRRHADIGRVPRYSHIAIAMSMPTVLCCRASRELGLLP